MASSWLSNIAASAKSLGEAALSEAQDKASKLRKSIEDELSSEYERTTAAADAQQDNSAVPAPPPPAQKAAPTAFERVTQVGAQLFSPLEDAGGTTGDPSGPERVVMLPWEQPGLSEETRTRMRCLSQERSIFLAPPAHGTSSFRLDLAASLPLLMEALAVDKHLDEQRNLLVPRQVTEEQFFTNYFHHLHVLARSGGGSASGSGGGPCSGVRSPSSSSPVMVSAAVSEASDVASTRDLERSATGIDADEAPGGALASTNLPPLATLLRADPSTPARPAACSVPIEEQFECVTNHLVASAKQRTGAAKTPGKAAVTPAQKATLDWEEELRAELS